MASLEWRIRNIKESPGDYAFNAYLGSAMCCMSFDSFLIWYQQIF